MKLRDTLAVFFSMFIIFGLFYLGSVIWTSSGNNNSVELSRDLRRGNSVFRGIAIQDPNLNQLDKSRLIGRRGQTKAGWKPASQHAMLNIEEMHVKREGGQKPPAQGFHKILHYTPGEDPKALELDNTILIRDCVYSNCQFTNNASLMKESAAVIFQASSGLDFNPPPRPRNQVWIVSDTKPEVLDSSFEGRNWKNAINWTISYRLDGDILWTPGTLRTKRPEDVPNKDYYKGMETKTRTAMTYISNCSRFENTGLKDFALKLKKHMQLDLFGQCNGTVPLPQDLRKTASGYVYFIVLEDFLCPGYVSKEVYQYFDLDTMLVVRGKDYERLFPNPLFFNAAQYDTVESLASALNSLSLDLLTYTEYVRNKDSYVTGPGVRWQCDVCEKINNQELNRQVYETVAHILNRTDCIGVIKSNNNNNNSAPLVMKIAIVVGVLVVFLVHFWKYCCRFYCRAEDGSFKISYFDGIDWSLMPFKRASKEKDIFTSR